MKQLIEQLRGFANSLENGWMDKKAVFGSLLIILESGGYLKKVEEHYVKDSK